MPSGSEESRNRDWRLYLEDMRSFALRAISYCDGMSAEVFSANSLVQDAVLRNIELIGEAAGRVPSTVREANPQIAWRQIVAMRNQLIHGYLGIDLDIVWDVVQTELPELLSHLNHIHDPLE